MPGAASDWLTVAAMLATVGTAVVTPNATGAPRDAHRDHLVPPCAVGRSVPGLSGYERDAVERKAGDYATRLTNVNARKRKAAENTYAAAAAAYIYGLSLVNVHETVRRFKVRNLITSIDALSTPDNETTVSPNVDTAYSVGWIDLTSGPVVISVANSHQRFYTLQLMDAYSNSFSYIGSGSTGTKAGDFAILPPGWAGTLPKGVTPVRSPTNVDWLLGRTLVDGHADLAKVKPFLQKIRATPLTVWETGARGVANVESSYPKSDPITTPKGTDFVATLNQELIIDPPPASDNCAVKSFAAAGVVLSHPTHAETLAADYQNGQGDPTGSTADTAQNRAVIAGTAGARTIIASATRRVSRMSAATHRGWDVLGSWIGDYGHRYLGRAIVATNLLGANIPEQATYPTDYVDNKGRKLTGSHRYTLTFPRGELPPVRAFWSLTMYKPDDFLYPNRIHRYAIGDRTNGVRRNRDGSLTLYLQHSRPGSAAHRANWLPAPAYGFHLILRLYQPKRSVLHGTWRIPPLVRG
jgi:hypothetical protein